MTEALFDSVTKELSDELTMKYLKRPQTVTFKNANVPKNSVVLLVTQNGDDSTEFETVMSISCRQNGVCSNQFLIYPMHSSGNITNLMEEGVVSNTGHIIEAIMRKRGLPYRVICQGGCTKVGMKKEDKNGKITKGQI